MPYKYYAAYRSISTPPNQTYLNDFQQLVTEQFYNASDVFTIQEESPFASNTYVDIDVRINHMIEAETGKNMSDDFKRILFKNIGHPVQLGNFYKFDDNYWIVFNVDRIKSLNSTVSVRRCNNTLRWMDINGGYHSIPCNIDYLIKENRDYSTAGSSLVIPSGAIEVLTQYNSQTNMIRPNQRFLFGSPGNWTAYKVVGGGIGNFNNSKTEDNESQGVIRFTMDTNYINESMDDLSGGIADLYQNVYTLTLSDHVIGGLVNGRGQLGTIVTYNGSVVNRGVVWSSSDPTVAAVNSTGGVTYKKVGTCTITCQLLNNEGVFDTANVTVSATPINDYKLVISPTTNYIFQGQTETYNVYLYLNGSPQIDAFTFTPFGVPSENYSLQVLNGNQFRIKNIEKYLNNSLTIHCTPNFHAEYATDIVLSLKGAW